MESSSEDSFVWTDASSNSSDNAMTTSKMNGGNIKVEPDSDLEYHKKKKAKKIKMKPETSEDESYLNRLVKQEQQKVKRRPDSEDELEACLKEESKKELAGIQIDPYENTYNGVKEDSEYNVSKKKKKKSKKKRKSSESSFSDDRNMSVDETIVKEQTNNTFNTSLEQSKDEISIIEKVNPIHLISPSKKRNKSISLEINRDNSNSETIAENNKSDSRRERSRRVVDSLVMEDDDSEPSSQENITSKVKKFVKANSNLKLVANQLSSEVQITKDDELWLIDCPKELEAGSFLNKKISLDRKFKVKHDGHTFEGSTASVEDRVAVMTMKHNRFSILSMPLAGIINLKRRVPKHHIQEGNIIENDLDHVINLPPIKCRHPLFGANYKAAIKLPKAIKEKLKSTQCKTPDLSFKKYKKQKKKDRMIDEEVIEPKEEVQEESSSKKKRKKPISDEEEPPRKKKKHKKHDITSSEAWDSEKAIEENLFNF